MRAADLADLARESLTGHRLRTGLTLIAIAIGVTAVLLLTALGDAAKAYVVRQFADMGTHLVTVMPGRVETTGFATGISGGIRDLTVDDSEALRRRVPGVVRVVPIALGSAPVEWGPRSRDVYVVGTTAAYFEMSTLTLAAGRGLPGGDPRRGERVVVIGPTLARELFGRAPPVGQAVRIAGSRFRVIGVTTPKGQSLGVDYDDLALVPLGAHIRVFHERGLHRIVVQAASAEAMTAVVTRSRQVLRDRHDDEEDFTVITMDAMMRSFRAIIDVLTLGLAGIAAISLAVAGIGVMNVMLVSVTERTAEVGLLKALGARPRQILSVFLAESVSLSLLGAVVGCAAGLAVIGVASRMWTALPLRPSVAWMAGVTLLTVVVGAWFGFLPARRASRLNAADALRGRR